MNTKDFLTDLEIAKIEAFCSDKAMYEAVRKVILQGIYTHGTVKKEGIVNPVVNGAFSLASLAMENPIPDEQLGAHIRTMWAGINAMKNAFDTLDTIKQEVPLVETPYNEAI